MISMNFTMHTFIGAKMIVEELNTQSMVLGEDVISITINNRI